MARPRTKPPAERRRDILDAARGILIRSGYRDLNLDEVARQAAIAKGTVYLYFKDKEDLLVSVFVDMLDGLEARLEQVAPRDGTAESLRRLVAEELDFVDNTHYFLAPFSPGSGILHGPKAGGAARQGRFQSHLEIMAGRIRACMEKGVLRSFDPLDSALFLASLMRMFVNRKFLSGSKRPLREQTPQLLEFFLHGLGTGRGKP